MCMCFNDSESKGNEVESLQSIICLEMSLLLNSDSKKKKKIALGLISLKKKSYLLFTIWWHEQFAWEYNAFQDSQLDSILFFLYIHFLLDKLHVVCVRMRNTVTKLHKKAADKSVIIFPGLVHFYH